MKLLTIDEVEKILKSEHKKHFYNKIYGKQIYPVVIGKLDFKYNRMYYDYDNLFINKSWYGMIR